MNQKQLPLVGILIFTSAGVSAGIDMSLYVVSRLYGADVAEWTARRMEYDWLIRQ